MPQEKAPLNIVIEEKEREERRKEDQRRPTLHAPSIYDRDLYEPPKEYDREPSRGVAKIGDNEQE